jgi:poly(A) RNA polymerase
MLLQISEQITILNDQTRLSEIGHRLRWITCIQIEQMLSRLFPSLQVLPFGSFVNGSARNGCDLDMAISLDGNYGAEIEALQSPLIFQAKAVVDNNRFQTQKHLEIFADLVQNYATGCIQVLLADYNILYKPMSNVVFSCRSSG